MIALDIISRRHGKARRGRGDEGCSRQGACTLLGEFRRLAVVDGHGTGRGRQPMGHVEGGALRDGARQVSAGGRQQETTRDNNQRRFTDVCEGRIATSRSIFSAGIEGEDIAAYGRECDIGSDTC